MHNVTNEIIMSVIFIVFCVWFYAYKINVIYILNILMEKEHIYLFMGDVKFLHQIAPYFLVSFLHLIATYDTLVLQNTIQLPSFP